MNRIDIEKWNRKEIFHFFSGMSNPFYMVTFRQDVTDLYDYVKAHDLSFYYSMCYIVAKAMNRIDAFQYVIKGEEVYKLAGRNPSLTDLKPGAETFHIVTMRLSDDQTIEEFCRASKKKSTEQEVFLDYSTQSDDLIYISCVPWVDITGVTNERDLAAPEAKDESTPHVTWGKYVDENGRKMMGISIEVNHRLIDGLHIGQFSQNLTEETAKLAI